MNKKVCARVLAAMFFCTMLLAQNLQACATTISAESTAAPSGIVNGTLSLTGGTSINFTEASKRLIVKFCAETTESAQKIEASLQSFEERFSSNKEEVKKCYESIGNAIDRGIISSDKASDIELCKHLVTELGDPSQVNQGNHNTCTLAALETKLYNETPSTVCGLIFQALTGTVTGQNGQTAVIAANMVQPDREAQLFHTGSPCRSYSSQIFQIAAANLFWQSQSRDPRGIKVAQGSIRYVQQEGASLFPGDTCERLIIQWADDIREQVSSTSGLPENSPAFSMACLLGTYEMLTGRSAKNFLLAHKSRPENKPASLFSNTDDLSNKLSALKKAGQLPAIIALHPNGGIIQTAPRLTLRAAPGVLQLTPQRSSSWHVVCISDYNAETGEVNVDNFWGPRSDYVKDRSIKLAELYTSSFDSQAKK